MTAQPLPPTFPRPGDRSPEAGAFRRAAAQAERARLALIEAEEAAEPRVYVAPDLTPSTEAQRAAYEAGMELVANHPWWSL